MTWPRSIPLRVYTSVPQAYAPSIKIGGKATVTLQEFPGQKFAGVVVRTADAIDPATRTLLTEVDVPNKDGSLLPGSFGEVHFAIGANVQKLTVPVNAMLFRAEGPQVAVVGPTTKCSCARLTLAAITAPRWRFWWLGCERSNHHQPIGLTGERSTGERRSAFTVQQQKRNLQKGSTS